MKDFKIKQHKHGKLTWVSNGLGNSIWNNTNRKTRIVTKLKESWQKSNFPSINEFEFKLEFQDELNWSWLKRIA